MTQNRSDFLISGAEYAAGSIVEALTLVREGLRGKLHLVPGIHCDRYRRQLVEGERPITLASFFGDYLDTVFRLHGREYVRRIGDALFRPFRLRVIPIEDRIVKDVFTEEREANRAVHRAFDVVGEAISDNVLTEEEKAAVTEAMGHARKELDDLEHAVATTPVHSSQNQGASALQRNSSAPIHRRSPAP